MKKIFVIKIWAILFLTTAACSASTFDYYKEDFQEIAQDPKDREFKGTENDVNDLRGCEVLVGMMEWEITRVGKNGEHKYYGRSQHWRKGTMNTETGVSLDFNQQQNSAYFAKQGLTNFVYIGPWYYSPTLQKSIRFFAYYPKEGGDVSYQYESQTSENRNIPEKKFSLSSSAKIAPDRFSLCVVKWTAKYGYNAISEVKSKNPFSKSYLVPTGKIIEAKE